MIVSVEQCSTKNFLFYLVESLIVYIMIKFSKNFNSYKYEYYERYHLMMDNILYVVVQNSTNQFFMNYMEKLDIPFVDVSFNLMP